MDWQNSSNAQAWYTANYGHVPYLASYDQPPPPAVGAPCWGPYGSYPAYPQSQWGYPMAPNYNVPPPPFQTTPNNADNKPPINPPLPPDPPPGEPPKEPTPTKESKEGSATAELAKPKDSPQSPVSNENNYVMAPNYTFPYQAYNNSNINWFPSNQQQTAPPMNSNDGQFMPIKFNLDGKKDLPPSNIETAAKPNNDTPVSLNSARDGKFSHKNLGKFGQINFTKGQNLSLNSKATPIEINSKSASELNKKPVKVLQSGDWPESLKRYVGKCFSRCLTELDKDQVEICLKGKLTQSAHSGSLWEKDWDKETLINVHSQAATESPNKVNQNSNSSLYQSDLSRGFILKKRASPKSPSREMRNEKRRSEDNGFLPLTKRGKMSKKRGKNKKNIMNNENQNNAFYSKMGAKNSFAAEKEFGSSEMMQKRAARFAPADVPSPKKTFKQNNRLGPRKKMNLMASINVTFSGEDNIDWESMHIIGTSNTLEKQFLRLTAAPDPSTVRTPATLKRALEVIKKKWVDSHDYRYTCNQLKSVRQDLTVQGIRNKFTIKVYETHCRVALEAGDHEEFNQCQSQLKQLYSEIGGDNVMEFTAYRLLYYIFTKNTLDITSLIAKLSDKDKANGCVAFALQIRAAWSLRNYYRFFYLYQKAPLMSGYLIDWFSERERKNAIKIIIKGYRPGSVNVDFVRSCLAFHNDDDWNKFVDLCGIKFTNDAKELIDCKNTVLTV